MPPAFECSWKWIRSLVLRWGGGVLNSPPPIQFLPFTLFLNKVTYRFKVGGAFRVQTYFEHVHPHPESPSLADTDQLRFTLDRGTFQFSLRRLKLCRIYNLNRVLLSCMFLKSDPPDLKCTGFVIWGKSLNLCQPFISKME